MNSLPSYKVKLSDKAAKQLENFPKDLQKRVIKDRIIWIIHIKHRGRAYQ